ncbi:NADH-quinone oxidoreductase subunit NuoE [Achromobacter xylosoxidans]|jgi:NADH-quinone oxidoreductase subunit E|uniref:NADH-quinone oxidoreductase subunit 2 n=7 Tax=Burkholderiales TaxID=80840 RepID=A0A1D8I570_9BURK|nr:MULTISPECIES: NADH-quinone oxidoreductase subunit NuoE [Achromobacter]ALX82826.1 NADH dehydrogenase [Achromobacter denitrificans]MBQ2647572.1 NADH-quinone oxidoreductase subunit NuoE [Achromobacter sp.]AHC45843.1 NADH-ubiquinone oxidoreductase chain E [Achromobacter xylosoxidans NBRC 15126 = ATCC 27061]AKP88757.1 NADH-ubiquinone oxidoreductase chain E [Achromobacter xylosoxidans]AMG47820.1 NADH-quinone oxidoreductase subunit NuoE [Achromobacter xylosoxidans]
MLLSEQAYQKIDRELAKFPADQRQSAIMASLAIAQEEKGWLATDIIEDVANYIGVPPIAVQEVATFYNMFDVKPVGKTKIAVCTNLPCALRDGERAGDYLKRKLGVDYRETTADGQFTLVEGECMGACGDSPVLIVNNKHMCVRMTEEKLDALVAALKAQGESA